MAASPSAHRRAWLLLPGGLALGAVAAFLAPGTAGCLYHDTCIKVTSPGRNWCRNVANALMWPVGGSSDDAEPIVRPDGATPRGCRCYNDAEQQILRDHAPSCRFDDLFEELELTARQECQALIPPGYDHNCWTATGPVASVVEGEFREGVGSCIGSCEYGAPPVNGSCPNPDPYECATGGGEECDSEGDAETTDGGDSGLDETGSSDESGEAALDVDALVHCDGRTCTIDETFARSLYVDISPIVDQGTLLVYDEEHHRHVFTRVEPGTLAHALGLRTGDRLESVNGLSIRDLDSALDAYVRLGREPALAVRVKRGSQWLDFKYTFGR